MKVAVFGLFYLRLLLGAIALCSCLGDHGVLIGENRLFFYGAHGLNYGALEGGLIGEVEVGTILGACHLLSLATSRIQENLLRRERLFLLVRNRIITEIHLDVTGFSEVVFLTARVRRPIRIYPFPAIKLGFTLACSLFKVNHLLGGVLPFETTIHLALQLLAIIAHASFVAVVKVA